MWIKWCLAVQVQQFSWYKKGVERKDSERIVSFFQWPCLTWHSNCLRFRLTMFLAARVLKKYAAIHCIWHSGLVLQTQMSAPRHCERMCCSECQKVEGKLEDVIFVLIHLSIDRYWCAYLWSLRLLLYAYDLNSSCLLQICPVECMGKMLHAYCIGCY